jgi:Cu+-exporting ATPase
LSKEIEVTFQPDVIRFSELVAYLGQLGYPPSLTDPSQSNEKKSVFTESTRLTIRMAVAGFCAGNIMLLSFPEYLGLDDLSYRHFLWMAQPGSGPACPVFQWLGLF